MRILEIAIQIEPTEAYDAFVNERPRMLEDFEPAI